MLAVEKKSKNSKSSRLWGVGHRAPHMDFICQNKPKIGIFEFISENLMVEGGRALRAALEVRASYPVALHGVSLSIGSAVDRGTEYVSLLKDLVDKLEPAIVSDHICWTHNAHADHHDLLPIPYTQEVLEIMARRLDFLQSHLGRRFYLENPSAYLSFGVNDYSESDFVCELIKKSGCGLLLDVNNLWVCHKNLGLDPIAYIESLPKDSVGQIHVAGAQKTPDGFLIDTHDSAASPEVVKLLSLTLAKFPESPVVLEWDDKIPAFEDLKKELTRIKTQSSRWIGKSVRVAEESVSLLSRNDQFGDYVDHGLIHNQEVLSKIILSPEGVAVDSDPRLVAFKNLPLGLPRLRGAHIYNRAFFSRHGDVLKSSFPILFAALGEQTFSKLAADYLQKFPPSAFSIDEVGSKLTEYFKNCEDLPFDSEIPVFVFKDLCEFEWMRWSLITVRDDAGKPLRAADFKEIRPEQWESWVLHLTSSARLLNFSSSIADVARTFLETGEVIQPEVTPTCVLMWRDPDDVIRFCKLSAFEVGLFEEIKLERELGSLAKTFLGEKDLENSLPRLFEVLLKWAELGLVRAPQKVLEENSQKLVLRQSAPDLVSDESEGEKRTPANFLRQRREDL